MKKNLTICIYIVLSLLLLGFIRLKSKTFIGNSKNFHLETSDIDRFWFAYDNLKNAHSKGDSIGVIQQFYLDKMSKMGKNFIEIRQYTAVEYLQTIRQYPKYFTILRTKTKQINDQRPKIDSIFKKLQSVIPNYKTPDICFAIGCFRGGGTTTKNTILIGAEISLADSTMDYSEFKGWLQTLLSSSDGNFQALLAHESIHCQQKHGQNRTLLSLALHEGTADFLPELILQTNINKVTNTFGLAHECDLWKEFEPETNNNDISKWLFNSSSNSVRQGRPADLGYFIGKRICEAYYNKQKDKKKAITNLLDRSQYLEVLAQSGYSGYCSK